MRTLFFCLVLVGCTEDLRSHRVTFADGSVRVCGRPDRRHCGVTWDCDDGKRYECTVNSSYVRTE